MLEFEIGRAHFETHNQIQDLLALINFICQYILPYTYYKNEERELMGHEKMNEDEIFTFYNIPKEKIMQFKKQFEAFESATLPDLTDTTKFEIYKLLFKRIQLFLDYSEFYRELEQKKDMWKPPGSYKPDELEELRIGYERDMRVQWKMLQAVALEGDWILRKIVGSLEKMEEFKEKLLDEDQ